jgi:Tfp pilus assembly protein PilO
MTDTRKWSAVAVVLVAAIFAAGWFLLIAPKRTEAADLKTKTVRQDSDNMALEQKLQELKAQQADLPTQRARLAAIKSNIPDNPALPSLIRDLTAAANKAGVSLDAMSPSAPQAISAPGAVAGAPAAAPAPAADAAGPAAAAPSVLYQVPMILNLTGNYFELEQFLGKLEGLKRSFLVSGFSIAPKASDEAPDGLGLAITGRVFLSADAPATATTATTVTPVAPATTS